MKKTWLKLVSAAAIGLIALGSLAQDYPNKPIKIIMRPITSLVPPAGNGTMILIGLLG